MKKKFAILTILALFSVSACATVSSYENINGQSVAVGQTSSGDTIKRFPYLNGTSLTVRYNNSQAVVTHVIEHPASDAQMRSFVSQASGCRPQAMLNQFNQSAQGGITITTYSISC
ncbi:hypothetical protein [Aliiroseovarius crassostreae]|uniref:hypothetical protein n=1 Tax=Aliiroseovarius crassostreae TaxID=154981 RepID=UPI001113559A|nr:hypothetical protein [Aliiroseovarius crassostreae]